jgi:hypothetical protein
VGSKLLKVMTTQKHAVHDIFRELGDVIMSCGGFAIGEFMNHYSARFGKKTAVRYINDTDPFLHTNFYHPYAFIGIPGLAPGKAFE